jgi:hypothetical protein
MAANNNKNYKNNKKRKNESWTAYKQYPRSVCITIYDMQGSPIPEDVSNRLVSDVEAFIKSRGVDSLAIAVNKG